MTEPRWDDDRLGAAFGARFGGDAPRDLASATVELVRSHRRPARRELSLRLALSVAAAAAVVILATAVGARLTSDGPAIGDTARGLQVLTVAEALEVQATGGDRVIAVRGWYSAAPPIRCLLPVSTAVNPVRLDCPRDFTWLLDSAEPLDGVTSRLPRGRSGVHPVFPGLDTSALAIAATGHAELQELVLIGHFNDRRARLCDAPAPACDSFVVDAIHSVAGVTQPPSTVRDLVPLTGEPSREAMWTVDEADRQARALAPSLDILSRVALPGHRIAELEPALGTGALRIIDAPVVWLINGLEAASDGTRRLRTLLLLDATNTAYTVVPWDDSVAGFAAIAPPVAAGSPGSSDRVVMIDDGVQVFVDDEAGVVTLARALEPGEMPDDGGRDVPSEFGLVRMYTPRDRPTELRLEWTGTPCDSDWSLVLADARRIVLDHPAIDACPSIPTRRGVVLTLTTPVSPGDVEVTLDSPFAGDQPPR